MRIVEPGIKLLRIVKDGAQLIEEAGRTCYKSEDRITDDSAEAFVQMIRKRGHDSVIEHSFATFRIVTDRGITHEIVRHRLASYSQESTRYCNYSKSRFGEECTFIRPCDIQPGTPAYTTWRRACELAEDSYFLLLNEGQSPQMARSVLPNCLKTEIVMTTNFREWLHFLKLRTAKAAHPDMRIIARAIGAILADQCPAVFGEYAC